MADLTRSDDGNELRELDGGEENAHELTKEALAPRRFWAVTYQALNPDGRRTPYAGMFSAAGEEDAWAQCDGLHSRRAGYARLSAVVMLP